ncbi:MAG: hypothetical protein GF347_02875 [Candidatus Moranbacteria bacterium]|nr:hypothetical protein [Candidatus Moranbacteria bacterium]
MDMTVLDFEQAIKNILRDDKSGKNPIPDPLRFSFLSLSEKNVIDKLKNEITKKYKPAPLLEIDVPKPNFTIRPMGRPILEDWILYQAIVDYLAKKIATKVSKYSYSIKRFTRSKNEKNPWIEFDAFNRKCYAEGFKYVVVSDITGYFEHIEIEMLKNKLLNYCKDDNYKNLVNFLCNNLLSHWSSKLVKGFGLPQGPVASSFLGDVYLDMVDKEMSNSRTRKYFRFMDDIRIFCKKEIEGRKALVDLIKILRKWNLSINAKKTKIISKEKIENELFDPKKTQLEAVQKAFDSRNENQILAIIPILVDDIFEKSFEKENLFSKTHLNFSTFRLKILKTSGFEFDEAKVVGLIKNNFSNKPHVSRDFCDFLNFFKEEKTLDFYYNFLRNDSNIYDWQELYVLRGVLELNLKPTKRVLNFFKKNFENKEKHWALRSLYCLLVGKYGDNKDRELLKDSFNSIETLDLKESIILSLQELGVGSRNKFYSDAKREIPKLSNFIDYVKNLKKPMYFRKYDQVSLERVSLIENNELSI